MGIMPQNNYIIITKKAKNVKDKFLNLGTEEKWFIECPVFSALYFKL